jgi:hypothetical protein
MLKILQISKYYALALCFLEFKTLVFEVTSSISIFRVFMLKEQNLFEYKTFNYVSRGKGSLIPVRRTNVEMLRKVKDYIVRDYEYAFG